MDPIRPLMGKTIFLLAGLLAALAAAPFAGPEQAGAEPVVSVTPERALLAPGETIRFDLAVRGEERTDAWRVKWEVIPRHLAVVEPSGFLTAGESAGKGIVRVVVETEQGRAVGHALLIVGAGEELPLEVRVEPPSLTLDRGGEANFSAVVVDPRTGDEVPAEVVWRLLPETLGAITADGSFVAGDAPGHGRIAAIASAGDRRGAGYAVIHVGGPEEHPFSLRVLPPEATVEAGGTLLFRAEGHPAELEHALQWSVFPGRIGSIAGGTFRAGPLPMEGRVVVTLVSETGIARGIGRVRVSGGGAPLSVVVRPADAAVRLGDEIRFHLVSLDDGGGLLSPVDWSVEPSEAGTITPGGVFRSGAGGGDDLSPEVSVARVLGTYVDPETGRSSTGTAQVRVVSLPQGAAIVVRPQAATVLPGEQIRFEAEGAPAGAPVDWDVLPRWLGTIAPDGLFTANEILADAASRELLRSEGIVYAQVAAGGRTYVGTARIVVGEERPSAALRITPPQWIGTVGVSDLAGGAGIRFRAELLSSAFSAAPVVEWKIAPAGPVRVEPRFGRETVLLWQPAAIAGGAHFPYEGRLVAELTLPNGRRIGASAPVRIHLSVTELEVTVVPPSIDLEVGERERLEVRATLPGGAELDHSFLTVSGTVSPQRLGAWNGGTSTFHATSAGEGSLTLTVYREDVRLAGQATVPVIVRGSSGPGTEGTRGGD